MVFEEVREVPFRRSGKLVSGGQIRRFGRPPNSCTVSIKKRIISEPFWVPEGPGPIWAVFGTVRGTPRTGRPNGTSKRDSQFNLWTRERRHEEDEEEEDDDEEEEKEEEDDDGDHHDDAHHHLRHRHDEGDDDDDARDRDDQSDDDQDGDGDDHPDDDDDKDVARRCPTDL